MATTCKLIAKNVLGSDTSSVTFSSIPATYTDLYIVSSARSSFASAAITAKLRFNGAGSDTNHSCRRLYGTGAAAVSDTQSFCQLGTIGGSTVTTDTFSVMEGYIPNYAGGAAKSIATASATENNSATAYILLMANLWNDTSAITSIEILGTSGNFKAGSSFFLYGITKA